MASNQFEPDAKYGSNPPMPSLPPYTIPMPPPNVTGRLHMGHAIFVALQDILARFHRMRGRPTLWLPGTDHAGIATQLQVEKLLLEEGTTREAVGRDEFLRRTWKYKEEQGGHIVRQMKSLGASADWSRERFTLDPELSNAVVEAFVQLHDKGLVYRGQYMVNWAPLLKTAVSDLEVDYTEEEGKMYYFKYEVEGSADGAFLPVATTRPETIFGDTAVCVNPDDPRYTAFIGKRVKVPTTSRSIPVISDEYVTIDFGTGALKITPGHDPNDYALGKKHSLPTINIMNKDATLNDVAGPEYEGLDRFVARDKLWNDMESLGLVIKTTPHMQRVPRSQRGGEIIEPLVSSQWFVKTSGMGKKALDAVVEGDIKIIPQRFEKVWFSWLEDIHDWCISRQLWWGHRIPVYYIAGGQDYVVAKSREDAVERAVEKGYARDVELEQDEDVLDTWFSSGLWPFATLGWGGGGDAESTKDLDKFYPAQCLETGYDILFFWVARMAMMGLELTGKAPFETVYMHGLVRAADGSKMSKTKGNVIDPVETVETFGADSLRYSLVTGVTPGQDIPLNVDKIESNKMFANKLWNMCKFVTENALKGEKGGGDYDSNYGVTGTMSEQQFSELDLPEKWIVSKCHQLVEAVTLDIENYQLGEGGRKVYEFLWDDFADWYIEISKTRLYEGAGGNDAAAALRSKQVLVYVLDRALRVLHPYMPFVTEMLWHNLPRGEMRAGQAAHSLMLADWPMMAGDVLAKDESVLRDFESFQALVKSIRNARAEYKVEQSAKIPADVVVSGRFIEMLEKEKASLVLLARLEADGGVRILDSAGDEAQRLRDSGGGDEYLRLVVQDGMEVFLKKEGGLIDAAKERERLQRQEKKLRSEADKLRSRLASKGYVDKAPAAVVDKARAELAELDNQLGKVEEGLSKLI
jgi:valyl-tRNA synthetase